MTISELYKLYQQCPAVQTDTRKLNKNDIFFALKGDNFNGNAFALKALEMGAAYAVVDEDIDASNLPAGRHGNQLIRVDNVLETLQHLAGYHREQFNIPFIAITGSNGKTTTKELIHAVLSSHYKTCTTEGNLNNHIGVPLTILKIKPDAQIAVIEMGANHQKEIEGYCNIAQPTHGIISNIGKAHLEGFGGMEGVKKGKGELYDFMRAHNGIAFAFHDYDYLHEMSKGIQQIIWYGTMHGVVCGYMQAAEPFLEVAFTKGLSFHTIKTNLVGGYNLPNILCAVTVGKYFKVPDENIRYALENYVPSNSRSQLIEMGSNKIILDAYNANPSSMKVAIENFKHFHAESKVLVLGGMMELGEESVQEHESLVRLIQQNHFENVILVGGNFKTTHQNFRYFNNADEAAAYLRQRHFANAYFLVKGSRSMQMEKVLTAFAQ
ncbi:UDP-N-acetylmuramoyl-tripeptide--D-alanyl-D-alanine ligase [Parafilimonas sp.]|uniref:UDP-N-acetylmuramoyl-tripeptide--D-alanyl-D- alanine ligase n=1 Tax=Parafilimonas sp. TaxID=1969739 RepID=UPI0039E7282A